MAVAAGGRFRSGSAAPGSGFKFRRRGWFQGLAWTAAISVFAMLVLGGVVRVTESGLGCGDDWPLCSGQWLPPLESKAIIEYAHRVAASFLVGPLVAATAIAAWLRYRSKPWILWPATAAIVLVIVQALLGAVTVMTELSAHVVMTHLAVAELTMACCVLVLIMSYRGGMHVPLLTRRPPSWAEGKARLFPPLSLVAAAALFLLLLSGSYLTNEASATWACPAWPLCTNDWGGFFPGNKLAMIHMAHRWVALIAGLVVMYALHLGFRGGPSINSGQPPLIRMLSMSAVALFVAQTLVGAGIIWAGFGKDVELRALHLALASGVWALAAALAILSYSREQFPPSTSSG